MNTETGDQHTLIWHNGSNTLWYALLTLNPEKDTVVAIVTNDGAGRLNDFVFKQAAKQIAGTLQPH